MIRLINLYKKFGQTEALSNINLFIPEGQIFGVIGRSGAGKSTLIRCLNLLERPDQGQIIIDNVDLMTLEKEKLRQMRSKIGMIFQHFNLLQNRTVKENIALPFELQKHKPENYQKRIQDLLELTGLTEKSHHYPKQLSGGQKQRVAIARALATGPFLLLSDEATSALDPETTLSILHLLRDINQEMKLTMMLITHEMKVVKEICDRVAVIDAGKIVEENDVLNFFTDPQSEIGKNFVESDLIKRLENVFSGKIHSHPVANSMPLIRIAYVGEVAKVPLIATAAREFSVDINILHANIEHIANKTVGVMFVSAEGNAEAIDKTLNYFHSKGVAAEIVSYIERNY